MRLQILVFIAIIIFCFLSITCYSQCAGLFHGKKVYVPFEPPPNPLNKSGWNLIVNDEFEDENLNHLKWDRGDSNDLK